LQGIEDFLNLLFKLFRKLQLLKNLGCFHSKIKIKERKKIKNLEMLRKRKKNLFFWENMKKDVAGGIGWIFVAALTSDIRRGSADTASFSSSSIRSSISSCLSEMFKFWDILLLTFTRFFLVIVSTA
jgi:hypothetical protein